MPGMVWLVGAGPGDPGLITVRGRELLRRCDALVHDQLVHPDLCDLAPASAERHDVGKRGHQGSTTQDAINALLVELAQRRNLIVRLKGGDPFLFGRGGEECAALAAAGIRFGVVPGVTAGTGVPAHAGIPVTHRAASSAVAFVTGHQARDAADPIDWASFARIETIVLYMGLVRLRENCAALIAHGRSADTPAAVIQWGAYPRQRTVTGTLATLPDAVAAAGLGAPAITVVGDVVAYRERIRWFDDLALRPLFGKRIGVTRAPGRGGQLARALSDLGADVVVLPLAKHVPPSDPLPLASAIAGLGEFDWAAFTSAEAVRAVHAVLRLLGRDARTFAATRIAAVGPATAQALERIGLRPDLIAQPATATGLAAALLARAPANVLLPQSAEAKPLLRDRLTAAGVAVTAVHAYATQSLPVPPDLLASLDAVAFASAATVERYVAALGTTRARALPAQCIAIGPETAAALTAQGLPIAGQAAMPSVAALAQAVAAAFAPTRSP